VDRQFLFIHIPKTAGKSFEAFLSSHFEVSRTLLACYWETVRKQPMSALADFELITGHIGYDVAFYLKNPFILTVLRHPVDRLCSVYEYLRQTFEENPEYASPDPDVDALVQLWKSVVKRSFGDFLNSKEAPVRAALLENPQARQLAQATPYLLTDFSDDQLYQIASSRLKTIDVVGSVDRFAEPISLTCRKTGWRLPEDFQKYRLNITQKRPVRDSLDPTLRKRIEQLSAIDMELYSIAKDRLDKDLRINKSIVQMADKGTVYPMEKSVYNQDGLTSLHNHDFMNEPGFRTAYARGVSAVGTDYQWHWRVHVGLWVAYSASKLAGDFVECGVNRGFLSSAIMEDLEWDRLGKTFYLLDTFAGVDEEMISPSEKSEEEIERNRRNLETGFYVQGVAGVIRNFSQWRNVQIIQGRIPDTLSRVQTELISYLHLDLNCAPPEVAALEYFWKKLVPGAMVLLDDYAYLGYETQKAAMDALAKERGVRVLSLPTGQGLIIRPPDPLLNEF
jgi:hypothetical protein